MARSRNIDVGYLNVKIHPHSDDTYSNVFESLAFKRTIVKYRGEKAGFIASFEKNKSTTLGDVYYGIIFTFTDFDPNSNWINVKAGSMALDDEIDIKSFEIFRPNAKSIPFVFFSDVHRFAFQKKMSPKMMSVLLLNLLNTENDENSISEVIVEPDSSLIKEIFEIDVLNKLEIFITIPNADNLWDHEEDVEKTLDEQNAKDMLLVFTSKNRKIGLSPDEDTRELSEVAASNGHVVATGSDADGNKISRSTKERPWVSSFKTKARDVGNLLIDHAYDKLKDRLRDDN